MDHGMAGLGLARLGGARRERGMERGEARYGVARLGVPRRGLAWQGWRRGQLFDFFKELTSTKPNRSITRPSGNSALDPYAPPGRAMRE
jgi:hypothetical protein